MEGKNNRNVRGASIWCVWELAATKFTWQVGVGGEASHCRTRMWAIDQSPWRMSTNSIVQLTMTNAWLSQQGVPSIEQQWVAIRYPDGPKKPKGRRGKSQLMHDASMRSKQLRHANAGIRPTAGYGPVRPVVWEGPVQTPTRLSLRRGDRNSTFVAHL